MVSVARVVVPNEIIADLVERVSCVEDIVVTIGSDDTMPAPIVVVTLEPSTSSGFDDDVVVLSVPEVATTIDRSGTPDPWVWTDPIRFAELAPAVAGALALSEQFDPELLDRCVARIDAQMAQLDSDIYAATQEIPDSDRSMDLSLPGTLYFANRYEFTPGDSDDAIEAGRIVSVTDLGGAASYDELMRANLERIIDATRQ